MSYDTVKNGIVARLNAVGLKESKNINTFEGASANEFNNTYILKALSGDMDEDTSETIIDRFYDKQIWEIQVAVSRSGPSEEVNRDKLHRLKDSIMLDLDKPANWTGVAKVLKYRSWELLEFDNYLAVSIRLYVVDQYTYS